MNSHSLWNPKALYRIDWRIIPLILALMIASLLVISATDPAYTHSFFAEGGDTPFLTPKVTSQLQRFFYRVVYFYFFCGDGLQ